MASLPEPSALIFANRPPRSITDGYKNPKTTLPKVQEALLAMLMLGYVNQDNEQYRLVG